MWPIQAVPAIDVELANEKLPPYPADDEARLEVWRAKRITTTAKETREYLAALFGARCHLCTQPIDMTLPRAHPGAPEIDHLVPTSAGGMNTWGNVALAHRTCNSSKNDLRGGVRDAAIYQQKLADALFIYERSAAIAMLRARELQQELDYGFSIIEIGGAPAGREHLGLTQSGWLRYKAGLEERLGNERVAVDAAWTEYAETRSRLGYPATGDHDVDEAIRDERPELDAVERRLQEKLAARLSDGGEMVHRLRGTIDLLERTQAMLDGDLDSPGR